MRPAVGASSPASMRIVVDLPEPFGPRKPKMPPRGMSKLTLSTAMKSPNRRVRSRTETIASRMRHAARPAASLRSDEHVLERRRDRLQRHAASGSLRSTKTSSSDGAMARRPAGAASSASAGAHGGRQRRRCRPPCRGRAARCRTATRRRRRRASAARCAAPTRSAVATVDERPIEVATDARRACRRRPAVRRRGSRCARRTRLRPCTASRRRWSGRRDSARAAVFQNSRRDSGSTPVVGSSSSSRSGSVSERRRERELLLHAARERAGEAARGTGRGRPCRAGAWRARSASSRGTS